MCHSILREAERALKGKYVAVYLGRLREQQKESVWQVERGLREEHKESLWQYTWEIEIAAKRKFVAVYLGRLREQQKESV